MKKSENHCNPNAQPLIKIVWIVLTDTSDHPATSLLNSSTVLNGWAVKYWLSPSSPVQSLPVWMATSLLGPLWSAKLGEILIGSNNHPHSLDVPVVSFSYHFQHNALVKPGKFSLPSQTVCLCPLTQTQKSSINF